jgi:hypothetical protein
MAGDVVVVPKSGEGASYILSHKPATFDTLTLFFFFFSSLLLFNNSIVRIKHPKAAADEMII